MRKRKNIHTLGDNGFAMFDGDFYPTPDEVIDRMLEVSDVPGKIILEPSAGRGNIVDHLNRMGAREVIVCEKQPDLKAILQTKKCVFLKDDFLEVSSVEVSHIDMIVMNPPFSKQYDHILHAWEIAPENCEIISLCNADSWDDRNDDDWKEYMKASKTERIKTKFGKRGAINKIIDQYGNFIDFDRCFSNAERKTDVRIGCIRVRKPASTREKEFENYFSLEEDFEPENVEAGIVTYDFVKDAVNTFVSACKMFDNVKASSDAINELTKHFGKYPPIEFGAVKRDSNGIQNITYETYKKELQKVAWQWLFDKFKMDSYVTKSVMENLNKFIETQTQVPFTVKNIYLMIDAIIGTHEDRMKKVLIECFDKICSFSADNMTTGGYKMNSGYKLTERFKIPRLVGSRWSGGMEVDHPSYVNSSNRTAFEDCIKALCYFSGVKYEMNKHSLWAFFHKDCDGRLDFDDAKRYGTNRWFDFPPFFEIKYYKNCNADLKWKNPKLLERFNQKVAELKGWALPTQSESTKRDNRNAQARETRERNKQEQKKSEYADSLSRLRAWANRIRMRNAALRGDTHPALIK